MGKKPGDTNLTFVVTTNPYDSSSVANKKQVRSVAALKSWPERRKRTFEQFEGSGGHHGGFVLETPHLGSGSGAGATKKTQQVPIPSTKSALSKGKQPSGLQSPASSSTPQPEDVPLFEVCRRAVDDSCECSHCRFERVISYSPLQSKAHHDLANSRGKKRKAGSDEESTAQSTAVAPVTPPATPCSYDPTVLQVGGRGDPFGCYPVEYRPWFDRILHHVMHVYAPRGWPYLQVSKADGLKWERFMTQSSLEEPALFYVRLLFACGDLIRLGVLEPQVAYWVKSQAIKAINEALASPERAASDPMILAIGRIALYEFQYGDKTSCSTIHRPAQARMIAMRGGMKAIGFPDLVSRLMRWADTVMATQTGTKRLIEDDKENPNFTIQQTVTVLEKWVPTEGKDLRNKIRISDLLTTDES